MTDGAETDSKSRPSIELDEKAGDRVPAASDWEYEQAREEAQDEPSSHPAEAEEQAAGDEVAELRKEREALQDKLLRAAADLENYKKRMQTDRSRMMKYRHEDLLRDILPILDNLDRAIEHCPQLGSGDAFVDGVCMIATMFKELLERYGVKEIEALDQPFDPNFHEAVQRVHDPSKEPNTVVAVLEKGYMYEDRLLRPAKVVVSTRES